MWAPTTADEVAQALAADTLPETLVFDGKEALPHPKDPRKSVDIATDVAAFANSNGGMLLYGVGEDKHKRLTRSTPIPLAGAAERVDQIVRTGVAEAPVIEIRPLPLTPGAPNGYLAVIVPPSPRAPHMVVVDGEHRYYGRSATGNYTMGEAKVASLYERRARWAVDRDTLLRSTVEEATKTLWPRAPQLAYLYVLVRPVISVPSLLDDGTATRDPQRTGVLNTLVTAATRAYPQRFDPDLRGHELVPPRHGVESRDKPGALAVQSRAADCGRSRDASDDRRFGDPSRRQRAAVLWPRRRGAIARRVPSF